MAETPSGVSGGKAATDEASEGQKAQKILTRWPLKKERNERTKKKGIQPGLD